MGEEFSVGAEWDGWETILDSRSLAHSREPLGAVSSA
jgi:hypothetical protein